MVATLEPQALNSESTSRHDRAFYDAASVEHVDAEDAQLAYRRFGSGPALLLVHGFPLHGFTWRRLLPLLSTHFTCHVVDLAGLGDSQWSARTDFGFRAHARRLKMLVDRLALPSYHLLAQDTGATIARHLALGDPQRVQRIALLNTEIPGHRPPWIQALQISMRMPGMQLVMRQLLRSQAFRSSGMGFGGCFCDLTLLDGDFHDRFVMPCIRSAQTTEGLTRYLIGLGWQDVDILAQRHAEIRRPVLLIWGEADPTFPIDRARGMIPQFADCRGLHAIPGARLLVHEEKPREVAAALVPFLLE